MQEQIKFRVEDSGTFSNTIIGFGHCNLGDLCINGGVNEWRKLQYEFKPAGELHFQTQYIMPGGNLV